MMRIRVRALVALVALPGAAWAGPPYVTDDPQPTDLDHWEIYAFGAGQRAHGSWDGAAGLDLNYGGLPGVQLTATLPVDLSHDSSGTHAGGGDVELGVKYRFLHREAAGLDIAVFPRVILPTARRRFGTGRAQVLLPVWAEKDWGRWSLFGGGGYTINPGAGNRDFWQGGAALTRTVSERLSLGAEATLEGPDAVGGHAVAGLGVGGVFRLGGPFALLVSGGPIHEHHGPTGWRGYAALGINF
ncbi:hypothetical protein GON01_02170 [Sphingomonas sp. MAH-20]|uniref:Transporter n=1 Tax=Sphingomonas horti TaxID=2682842 RepID=A0A6I4IX98_9SPHN|nr:MULTISPECIES: hypothetical protein [Sphingomonas]MBA2920495.1 hypothetical protein [Sphingomonas sp. CGMCC 1.13658]MVO76747.1 hypothetical protein [Sphingomonas horti]